MQENITGPGDRRLQFPLNGYIDIGIVGGNKFGRYKKISSEETYNMIVSDDALVNFPGNKKILSFNGKKGRTIYSSSKLNKLFFIYDNDVILIDNSLSYNHIGSLSSYEGNVYVAENNASQVSFCDNKNIYTFDYAQNKFYSSKTNFIPEYLSFHDTYLITTGKNTNRWILSKSNDASSFDISDPQSVGEIQSKVSNCIAAVPLDRQLFVFSNTVTEIWSDIGSLLFPYQRNNSYTIDYGCFSAATIASGNGLIVWLGYNEKSGLAIMMSNGGMARKISSEGLDYFISRVQKPENSFGFLFRESGHVFYVITFISANKTFVFDFTTNLFFTLCDDKENYFKAKKVAFFNGKNYFASDDDANIYELSSDYNTYDGKIVPRHRIVKPIRFNDVDRFGITNIGMSLRQGNVSKDIPDNKLLFSIPKIHLSISRDGGESYSSVIQKNMNKFGQRENTFNFFNLGSYYDCRLKFSFWGNESFCVLNSFAMIYK